MGRLSYRIMSWFALAALLFGSFGVSPVNHVVIAQTSTPESVVLVGDLQSEVGCSGDWDPTCALSGLSYEAGDDIWQAEFTIPEGGWQYKAALNGSWDENYGANAVSGGENIPLAIDAEKPVKFYYDHKSHWITDNINSSIVTVPGSFQDELGCPGDWQPDCLLSWLQDVDGDGTYTLESTALPAGTYEAKAVINESWAENYGQGGVRDGANILFSVPTDGAKVVFEFDSSSHVLTIIAGHAADNNVEWDGLWHDSRDLLYRTPGGAVPAGTPVTLRFRTFHDDVTGVKARIYSVDEGQTLVDMKIAASDVSCYADVLAVDTCDFWEATLLNEDPDNLWYRFIITDGTSTAYYADNTAALDGGVGSVTSAVVDNSFALMVYEPDFTAPAWVQKAIIYQIFPDRFRNGNVSNDPQDGQVRYDDPAISLDWGTLPEGYCRNYSDADPTTCPWRYDSSLLGVTKEQPLGRDYYGGDIEGVIQKLPYLKALGVTQIYFNPIFAANSNHRYDTYNFTQIDPNLGTEKDFKRLVNQGKKYGIKIMLDGVFNHMSSDSSFFDRYHHFSSVGACESAVSQWRNWFYFKAPGGSEPSPCVPTEDGGADTYYTGWYSFDSIPVLNKMNEEVQSYFVTGSNSITNLWLNRGAYGWRMDVMGDSSFPDGYWEDFRQVTKQKNSSAVIVGELWQKDSTLLRFLRGDRADTTMNYRLRDAVVGLLTTSSFDSKGFADSGRILAPSEFASRLLSIREDYPDAAYYSLMNLLDSHDTERILWTLTPGAETRAEKEFNADNLSEGKQRVKLASLIQFTVPGAPSIYYGDEVGVTGDDDPDDRRTYPWADQGGNPDLTMAAHYRTLAITRRGNEALITGDFKILLADDAEQTLAYGRKTNKGVALVALNISDEQRTINIPVNGYLPDGIILTTAYKVGNALPKRVTVSGGTVQVTIDAMSGLLLTSAKVNLTPPTAPTDLQVSEGDGQAILQWSAVPGTSGYNIYRSPVSGGGFVKINAELLTDTGFIDTGLRNATLYFYTIQAVNSAGVEGLYSAEVSALPHLSVGWANLQWPPTMEHTVSAVNRTSTAYGQVWIDGVTTQVGASDTLVAQLGFGPAGSNPDGNEEWVWVDAVFNVDAGNNDEFMASMQPEVTGSFDYLFRYTTTKGRDWLYADLNGPVIPGQVPVNPGKLSVLSSGDVTAPPAPSSLWVNAASPAGIDLGWDDMSAEPDLFGYEVLRSDTAGGPYNMIARVTAPLYLDAAVIEGATYYYVVRSVDVSFNRSEFSNEVSATAALRTVNVTFDVTVPETTDATGLQVYIAGTLDRLNGGLPQWNPGAVSLTRLDATHWTITLTGAEATNIEYKYTLGDWDHVEKDSVCGEISNRQLTLSYGSDGTQTVEDTVLNWRNVSPCGN